MKIQELIDHYLKGSSYKDSYKDESSKKSCYEIACEFAKSTGIADEDVSETISEFIRKFANGETFNKTDFNSFYGELDKIKNLTLQNTILGIINEIAMDLFDKHQSEIQGFVAQIEDQLNKGLRLSFPPENCMRTYQGLLNIYCLVEDKKLPLPMYEDIKTHFSRCESDFILNEELPFAINALTLMNKLPKEGTYCDIKLGEPIYPIMDRRSESREIPFDRKTQDNRKNKKAVKDAKIYFPFKKASKIRKGATGDTTFLLTNGEKILFARGSVVPWWVYVEEPKTGLKAYSHGSNYYCSTAVLASKIASFVSREHFSSERLLSNSFSASKKHPNYVLSLSKEGVRGKISQATPGVGIVDEVLNFVSEQDRNAENFGSATDKLHEVATSKVCKIDFDRCDLVAPLSKEEYEKDQLTQLKRSFKKPQNPPQVYEDEKLYARLKLAVLSKEFILALTKKSYPEDPNLPKVEKNQIAEKDIVVKEMVNRTEIALSLFIESSKAKDFLDKRPNVLHEILDESIEYIRAHFSEEDQPELIESIEKRIQFVSIQINAKIQNINLQPLKKASEFEFRTSENVNPSKQEVEEPQQIITSMAPTAANVATTTEKINKQVAQIKLVIRPHKRTAAFVGEIKKEIIRIESTSYGYEHLKQNKIALLKFLQDFAEKINPMNFSEMISDICKWPVKEINTLKTEIENDYGVTLKEVNLQQEGIGEKETVYSLLSKKRRVYKSTVFEFFNDAEPKSKQLIDKYMKPNIDEKYGTYAESLGPRCS